MMKNNVVKSSKISHVYSEFSSYLQSSTVNGLCRKHLTDFTRNRKMNFYMILYYFIFRNKTTTNSELSHFYASLDQFEKRISKQALNKAIRKVNPNVFVHLINQFASIFYSSGLSKTYRGYHVLAEDGTYIDIPYNIINLNQFQFSMGKHVHDMFDVFKVQSKAGGLYDVLNGIFVDFSLRPAPYSETPLAFEHLYRTENMFKDKKVLYIADRYYGSAEIISHLEFLGYKYCIRGKTNFYKRQVSEMTNDDEWIEVNVDEKWIKRFRFSDEAKESRKNNPVLRIRVIKRKYEYKDTDGNIVSEDLVFFTNLSQEEFSADQIIELYASRWDIEVSYKTLKSVMELERFISEDGDVAECSIYGKILYHNIIGILRKEFNDKLDKSSKEKKYVVNITQLMEAVKSLNIMSDMFTAKERKIKKKIDELWKMIDKMKVPVRPNRHFKRWGRVIATPPSYRFRLDGRNNPKLKRYQNVLITVAP